MSYEFSRDTGNFTGDFGAGNTFSGIPITLFAWVKGAAENSSVLSIGESNATRDFSAYILRPFDPAANIGGLVRNTTGTTVQVVYPTDGEWYPVLWRVSSSTSRLIRVGDGLSSEAVFSFPFDATALRYVALGGVPGLASYGGKIAECAIWDRALTVSEQDQLLVDFKKPTAVSTDGLRGYWSLASSNSTQSDLSGNGGPSVTLTGSGTYSADHPPVTDGSLFLPYMPALYRGGTLLSNRSNIDYKVTDGHTDLTGDILASGTATTDNFGVPVFPIANSLGPENATVTVSLLWTEGSDPELSHSVVHKTILTEAS
jgi:hypothetical protein